MNISIFLRPLISISCAFSMSLSGFCFVQAASASENSSLNEFPGRRVGGGSRGECMSSDTLVALSPKNHLIETISTTPTLYFSMPAFEDPLLVEFVLKNKAGDIIADKLFETGTSGGLQGLNLANHISPLDVGEEYEWYVSVLCNPNNRAQDLVVHGWMRHVSLDANEPSLENLSVVQQVASYQSRGLWHDAITLLAQSQIQGLNPAETTPLWSDLLEEEGLHQVLDATVWSNMDANL